MAVAPPSGGREYRGHVDFFGFHDGARALVFGGWASHALADALRPGELAIAFSGGGATGQAMVSFYPREALGALGIGMLVVMPAGRRPAGAFLSITVAADGSDHVLLPTPNTQEHGTADLPRWLAPMLAKAAPPLPPPVALALSVASPAIPGAIEIVGHAAEARSWLACGWVAGDAPTEPAPPVWRFPAGEHSGGVIGWYPRPEFAGHGVGFVALLPDAASDIGALLALDLGVGAVLRPGADTRILHDAALQAAMRGPAGQAWPAQSQARLLARLAWRAFAGADTLGDLADRVLLEIDQTIHCPPHGLVLMGWMLAAQGAVREIRLRGATRTSVLDLSRAVRFPRPAVIDAVGRQYGFDDVRCGFAVFVPDGWTPPGPVWLEVETARGGLGHKTVPMPKLHGMAAIRTLLADSDMQFADVAPAFEHVFGPAIAALNESRLRERPSIDVVQYGDAPADPAYTVVVPLFGRLEFMEVQAALFARDPEVRASEIIYVLDDPPKRRDAENLAASIHARFALPLTLIVLGRNLGFAPACNIGLAAAHGRRVCFLNSDAFPLDDGWLGRLAARLAADPALGMVGPLLLHDDGTVQHQGMGFRRQPRYGNWYFGRHDRLGQLPPESGGLRAVPSITGACVVMDTQVARRLGGFDEAYVIGDFEDSDLCLRARAAGFGCAVDLDVRLCHLGRRSQVSTEERWRMNLTLYNAWLHHGRWEPTIARLRTGPEVTEPSIAAAAAAEPPPGVASHRLARRQR